jgi:Uma2 family endonuclease
MSASAIGAITLEQFLKFPETKPASEYIDGEILQKPMPKGRHSRMQGKLCAAINQAAEGQKIAYAFPELRCSFGGRSIVPDIAVFLWERIPFTAAGEVPDDFGVPPDWTIEILSPQQNANRVIGNILHCLNHGCSLGWFVDPDGPSILAFARDRQPVLFRGGEVLPVLPDVGLTPTAEEVFGWLRMDC